jgi:hypothetical protein
MPKVYSSARLNSAGYLIGEKKTWLVIKHGDGKSGKSIVLAFPNQASHNAQQAKQYCLDWFPEDNFFVLNPVLSSWSLNTIYTASPFFM